METVTWKCLDEFSIRELYDILKFRQQIFVVEQKSAYPDLDDRDQTAVHLLIRERAGPLLAYARVSFDLQIARLSVSEANRGKGYGRRLMDAIMARFPGMKLSIAAEEHLVKFYEYYGFEVSGSPYEEYGTKLVFMRKTRVT